MAKLPPLTLKLNTDLTELRIVVEELADAFKRIDERLVKADGESWPETQAPIVNVYNSTTMDAQTAYEQIAKDAIEKIRNARTSGF